MNSGSHVMESLEDLQVRHLGEEWVRAVGEGAFDRIAHFCVEDLDGQLLLPRRLAVVEAAPALAEKFHQWFADSSQVEVETSRISRVGGRLGIFYRLRVQENGDWFNVEQQVYCTLRDGLVEKVHLLCSGWQLIAAGNEAVDIGSHRVDTPVPAADGLLEFYSTGLEQGSVCARLTPAIREKLRGLQSGQVLEVRVDDSSARADVESWSRLSGNQLMKMIEQENGTLRFFLKKK